MMTTFRLLAVSLSFAVLASPLLRAADLSKFRSFQLGTDLPAVAGLAEMSIAEARVIRQRPALIQELTWRPQPLGPSAQAEAVKEGVFSFYNGELYRIVINYDRYKTEGLTAEDLTAAISAAYGAPDRAAAEIALPTIYGDSETSAVVARWEDSKQSVNLVRSSYEPSFALVVLSKRLDALARAAATEAIRLDELEAPRREIELQKKQEEENRVQQEKARLANKPSFRP